MSQTSVLPHDLPPLAERDEEAAVVEQPGVGGAAVELHLPGIGTVRPHLGHQVGPGDRDQRVAVRQPLDAAHESGQSLAAPDLLALRVELDQRLGAVLDDEAVPVGQALHGPGVAHGARLPEDAALPVHLDHAVHRVDRDERPAEQVPARRDRPLPAHLLLVRGEPLPPSRHRPRALGRIDVRGIAEGLSADVAQGARGAGADAQVFRVQQRAERCEAGAVAAVRQRPGGGQAHLLDLALEQGVKLAERVGVQDRTEPEHGGRARLVVSGREPRSQAREVVRPGARLERLLHVGEEIEVDRQRGHAEQIVHEPRHALALHDPEHGQQEVPSHRAQRSLEKLPRETPHLRVVAVGDPLELGDRRRA
jgi:hypothetical protein